MSAFTTLVKRDLALALKDGGALGTALGLGPDLNLLSRIAPGMLWIALLLAALLSLARVFESDYEDGSLDALTSGPLPLELIAAAKALAHWISTGIPLALLAPVLGLLLNLDLAAYPPLMATMFVGTPAISFLGSIGAALTLKARRGGLLVALLVLPLYIPTLIFGISALSAALLDTGGFQPAFLILAAITLFSLVLGPFAAAAALRMQLQ